MPIRHIVLFRFHPEADDLVVQSSLDTLRELQSVPGLLEFRVERSNDYRKGRVIVENALFADEQAFEAFRAHPLHAEATERLSQNADWFVADYVE